MSTFGYHKELGRYEEVDEEELLATLTSEELQELESELADIDPDDNVPIGLRQKDQTAKTPIGTFSRVALLKYFEDETLKLLDGNSESCAQQESKEEEEPSDKSERECGTQSDSNITGSKDNEENNKGLTDGGGAKDEENDEEKKDKCKKEPFPTSDRCGTNADVPCGNPEKGLCKKDLGTETTDLNLNATSDRLSGNPIVIDEALEQILHDDPAMTELNLNNIEDISQETLLRFAEALSANTHVQVFSLANTHADDRVAFAISKMLRENRSVTNLNVESNFVSGRGLLALLASLQHNRTIVELRFHNQRHICGGQVEMEMVQLLRDNTTLLKLGYQFDLPGPRMTATSILTRNQDRQRQRRLRQQREQGLPELPVTKQAVANPTGQVSGSKPKNRSNQTLDECPQKLTRNHLTSNKVLPPPPPPPPPSTSSEKNKPTRKIADMIKQHEGSNGVKGQPGPKKSKSKKGKNGSNEKESTDILKELRNSLKPSLRKRKDDPCCPLAPQRSGRDDLMEAIRGSSIRSLKRVNVQK
ncbi:leiomodin-2a [Osmerus eperlanus]|uniref:leiomodin-2a n=1 Tax=Osmerus eperlanus TaxID=29151 RepID=UPI002E0E8B5B